LQLREPTRIGSVRHVLGSTVTVELDPELAGIAPIWEGHLQPVGQIGSVVRIPQGPVTLLGTVTMVGISELGGALSPSMLPHIGDRWLQIQLLGEIDGIGRFIRGVSSYPGLNDAVHFATKSELTKIYPAASDSRIQLGGLSAAPDIPLTLDAARLVTRHSAVVGSTGSGKTSAVATVLQSLVKGGFTAANVVIIDPHGEYAQALKSTAAIKKVIGDKPDLLRIPYWALPASDLLRILTGVETATLMTRFTDLVVQARRAFANEAAWLAIDEAIITADTPTPFDLHGVWYKLAYENTATYSAGKGVGEVKIVDEGDAVTLKPPEFENASPNNTAPFKGPSHGIYSVYPDRMRLKLLDPHLAFLFSREDLGATSDPLVPLVEAWLGGTSPIAVLDLSGVPYDITDLSVGLILQLLFEIAIRSVYRGIGRPSPVLVVLEEAHRYLGESSNVRIAKEAVNRIAREGRKYGMGIMLVSQRPSELPDTALSQVGTIVALRLTNGTDQGTVKKSLPDSIAGLADVLPSLRTGEAIVSGEAVTLPTRVLIDAPNPAPAADDPPLRAWRTPPKSLDLAPSIASWRGIARA
jgi:uncharacterized protein